MNSLGFLKQIARKTPLGFFVKAARSRKVIQSWQEQGKPVPPPPAYKQSVVKKYSREFHLKTLVETGTYLGEMVAAQSRFFSRIYTIELDNNLYQKAKDKFAAHTHVTVMQGDSSQVLSEIINKIDGPCLFWLDAHYSGDITARGSRDTPIIQELEIIFHRNNAEDVILIDDARCFDGTNDYPTLAELQHLVTDTNSNTKFEVADDIIRLTHNLSGVRNQ